jgi:hypothetical protein
MPVRIQEKLPNWPYLDALVEVRSSAATRAVCPDSGTRFNNFDDDASWLCRYTICSYSLGLIYSR